MFLRYFALIGVFALKNIDCYSPNRQPRLTTTKSSNNQEQVIPARYKIKSSLSNYEPTIAQNIHTDNFPEVEYPSSIMDSSKPFYLNVSPFSNDVKSSFKSLVSGGTTKQSPTIVVNLKPKENQKEKGMELTVQKLDVNETKITDNVVIVNNTVPSVIIIAEDDNKDIQNNNSKSISNSCSVEQANNYEEIEYVIGLIDDLDQFMTTITDIETECIPINNSTSIIFDSEHANQIATITSNMTSTKNDSVAELNEYSLYTEPSPVFDKSKHYLSNVTASVENDTTENSFSSQVDFDSIEETTMQNDAS